MGVIGRQPAPAPELALAWAMDYLSPTEKQRLETLATGNIEKVSVKTFGTGGA